MTRDSEKLSYHVDKQEESEIVLSTKSGIPFIVLFFIIIVGIISALILRPQILIPQKIKFDKDVLLLKKGITDTLSFETNKNNKWDLSFEVYPDSSDELYTDYIELGQEEIIDNGTTVKVDIPIKGLKKTHTDAKNYIIGKVVLTENLTTSSTLKDTITIYVI